ncbi:TIGR01244 family phosphatase [Sphingomonas suaedae]|uniref:TIGR01244 family phosphatase n=1 Tax=Sphingomonas suaedae TaxID=2599297 RepID=A0A518RHY9_9SPHN|nr:TIGR01244 family sulfur transferase [Sphingomonas suaedae]QDX27055.1 TIGR01244 family phosphatase [Sphingomonas suaedae]
MRTIDETISVSSQITPAELTEIARAGFRAIVNNRPDEEEPGQPSGDAIRTVAETLGLSYHAIPVTHAGFSMPQVEAMRGALEGAGGPVFAFCRSGTRSTNLWALAEASRGTDPDTLVGKAANAGYDISSIRPMLDALSGQA